MFQTLKFFAVMWCAVSCYTEDGHGATEQGGYGTSRNHVHIT